MIEDRSLRGIYFDIFGEEYILNANRQHNIGDIRKTASHWLDLDSAFL
jgi:hypothetical protein